MAVIAIKVVGGTRNEGEGGRSVPDGMTGNETVMVVGRGIGPESLLLPQLMKTDFKSSQGADEL